MHNPFITMGLCITILDKTKVTGKMPKWRRNKLSDWVQEGHIEKDYCSKCIHNNWRLAKNSCTTARFDFETEVGDVEKDYDPMKGLQ